MIATGAANVAAGAVTLTNAAALPPDGKPSPTAAFRSPNTTSSHGGARHSSQPPRQKQPTSAPARPPTGKAQWWLKKSSTLKADLQASKKGYQVYVLKDSKGNVLYVGKSGGASGVKPDSWEDRIRKHINDSTKKEWIGEVDQISVTSGLTEMEAFAAEEDLIRKTQTTNYNRDPGEFTKRFGQANLSANSQSAAKKPTFNFRTDIVP
jgi:Uri superfamily endonuclease